jgi:hypothetical protein
MLSVLALASNVGEFVTFPQNSDVQQGTGRSPDRPRMKSYVMRDENVTFQRLLLPQFPPFGVFRTTLTGGLGTAGEVSRQPLSGVNLIVLTIQLGI